MSFELNKLLAAKREPLPTSSELDPVTASIIRGALETICFEACAHLGRAASSPIINQSNERNSSIIDSNGRLVVGSVGTPHLTFVTQLTVRYGLMHLEDYDWGPGDVFLGNDPDHGGGHLPDYNVYAPVFDDDGNLVMVQALQAHQGDTGGKDPGGFTLEATDIFTEGLAIPCLKLVHRGEKRRDVIKLVERNNRFATFSGDLAAMIGGVQMAAREHQALIRKYGTDNVRAALNYSVENTESRFREEIAKWPDGTYESDVWIDADTQGTPDVHVHVACKVKGDQLTVDLTGTDDRQNLVGVWNTFGNTRGYIMIQLGSMVDPTIPKNEGLFNAVEFVIPEGCIAHPPPNKPAALGSFHPACEITEAVCIALSNVVPERAQPQVYKIGMPNAVIGFYDNGMMWMDQGVDSRSMDVSAVKGVDGWGSCPASLGSLLLSMAEESEARFPVMNVSREMTTDGGGAGQWRGAPGSLNVKKVLEPVSAMAWMVSAKHPLRGMCGGDDAIPYSNHFLVGTDKEYKIELVESTQLPTGAVMAYQHGGGAGFGLAIDRDADAVKEDVLDEYVSLAAAKDKYGVVLTGSLEEYDLEVDRAATEALRSTMRSKQNEQGAQQ
ncbi:hydantoinase B/oxoprolinase family protein [Ketobacter sp. MCCC 1A13808]|uniref:hydantoinase B/oxoprolinase family protein n=1 Tax=Ketobacter sp. MCCC 1A13808 TaxID=2602738 RepID=UPI000F0F39EC|nr:hydantoinase B/oxoprolinase family protein [Ketobacter sp. MCCC 1A13808]MVF13502.1 hydantoinase B/oxoprolinase family protein [Ketobacter sp. MCCC 1A13808]RLP52294.1 MAG: hydantoinase B/oxoprolinase family protein [Ketobacter sp.]